MEPHEALDEEPDPALAWGAGVLGLDRAAVGSGRRLPGSMSGAGVFGLLGPTGPVVLKVVLALGDQERTAAARREVSWYECVLPHVPLRTPSLLAAHIDDGGVALLLSGHGHGGGGRRVERSWQDEDWRHLARDLAALHAAPVAVPGCRDAYGSVLQALRAPDAAVLSAFWSRGGEEQLVAGLLGEAAALEQAVEDAGCVVAHGDCHRGNLLQEGDGLVWLDWQEAGMASPALDLAFCAARAAPDGCSPDLDLLVAAYVRAAGGRAEPEVLRRAVVAAELAVLVASWPHFAAVNTPQGVDRVHQRVADLAALWWGRAG